MLWYLSCCKAQTFKYTIFTHSQMFTLSRSSSGFDPLVGDVWSPVSVLPPAVLAVLSPRGRVVTGALVRVCSWGVMGVWGVMTFMSAVSLSGYHRLPSMNSLSKSSDARSPCRFASLNLGHNLRSTISRGNCWLTPKWVPFKTLELFLTVSRSLWCTNVATIGLGLDGLGVFLPRRCTRSNWKQCSSFSDLLEIYVKRLLCSPRLFLQSH